MDIHLPGYSVRALCRYVTWSFEFLSFLSNINLKIEGPKELEQCSSTKISSLQWGLKLY